MTVKQADRRVLRPRAWLLAAVIGAAAVFTVGAVFMYREVGWTLASIALAAMSLVGCAAIGEVATSRVVLTESTLESGSMWSRHHYAAADIASVTWEAGAGVSIKLASGGWARLPELGYNSQGLANTVRAWLKRRRPGEADFNGREQDQANRRQRR